MQKTPAFTICSFSSWLTCKPCSKSKSKALPFYKLRTPGRNLKIIKTLPSLRSKMSPEITSNDPRVLILHVQRNISSFNLSTGTNILVFCTERQSRKIHVLDATHSRPQSHSTTWPRNDGLWGREYGRDVLTPADTRTTAWACATFLLFENLLPVASCSRHVSDLKVTLYTQTSDKLKLT